MMSTSNLSFYSPIAATKSNLKLGKQKDPTAATESNAREESKNEAKLEEEKRAKIRDLFAPEGDMFAEEYNVSYLFNYFNRRAHVKASFYLVI